MRGVFHLIAPRATFRGMPAWKPGQSGNPGGRPKLTAEDLECRAYAREKAKKAMERLFALTDHPDGKIAVAAIKALLDRAFGSPPKAVYLADLGTGDGAPAPDLTRLSRAQRIQLESLLRLASGQGEQPAPLDS